MQVLFVQGGGEGAHDEWDSRLVDSLSRALGPDYDVRYPRLPHEAEPTYEGWSSRLAEELAGLEPASAAVGHSIGGALLMNTLAAGPTPPALSGVFLVAAPFIGTGGWPPEGFDPPFRAGVALPAGMRVYLYYGDADETVPAAHAQLYVDAIPDAVVRRFSGRDHQFGNDLSEVARDIRALN